MPLLPDGVHYFRGYLSRTGQEMLRDEIRALVAQAPFFRPAMPRTGKLMSVRMSNCGALGWVSDREKGYRYQETHPLTGKPWPDIPASLLDIWKELSAYPHPPEACLINFYDPAAKMGLHQDKDEQDFDAPVVSVSLGDSCAFRIAGATRKGPKTALKLESGDVLVFGGKSRLCFHGVERIHRSTSTLLKDGGRINLTLRRVTKP